MILSAILKKIVKYSSPTLKLSHRLSQKGKSYRQFQINIQNQHQFHHTTFAFFREVLSCSLNPALITNPTLNIDARMRAKRILDQIISVGSYSESKGIRFVRENICKYIARMDGVQQPSIDEVIITEGAERAVHLLLSALIVDERDVVMMPAPTYPLYSDVIRLNGGTIAEYRLNEQKDWDIDIEELDKVHEQMRLLGKNPKAILIINPGNPTGYTLSAQTIGKVLEFSVKNRLFVIADQVFRENIYKEQTKFRSCRSVIDDLPPAIRDNCQLASIHSISKGLIMAPGLRGGYLYLHNLAPFVMQQLNKFQTFFSCSNSMGQLMIDLMVNPFEGMSDSTRFAFQVEYKEMKDSIKRRGNLMANAFREMENMECKYADGGMYVYPSIRFTNEAVKAAQKKGLVVDQFYCHQIQQNTGTTLVPGSTFSQPQDSHHFRVSPCILPEKQLQIFLEKLKKSNLEFHRKYTH